ncbi:MAG: DUF4149 domain-containing protein [Rhodoferax sp.]
MRLWRFATSDRAPRLRSQRILWVAAAWWASLSLLGFVIVPLLFVHLPTPAMAGSMAGHLFSAQTWISIACTVLLLALRSPTGRTTGQWIRGAAGIGLLCVVSAEWIATPHIVARDNLALWHRVGSGLYLVQWLCAITVFHTLLRSGPQALPAASDQV